MSKLSNIAANLAIVAVLLITTSASAEGPAQSGVQLIHALTLCRKVTDPATRLGCYDKTSETIVAAQERHDIVIVDREAVKQARRSLFGFTAPSLNLFGHSKDKAGAPDEEIKQIEGIVQSAHILGDGNWSIILDDQAVWVQTDNQIIVNEPGPGSKITIKRGALGAFWIIIDRQPAVKARRAG